MVAGMAAGTASAGGARGAGALSTADVVALAIVTCIVLAWLAPRSANFIAGLLAGALGAMVIYAYLPADGPGAGAARDSFTDISTTLPGAAPAFLPPGGVPRGPPGPPPGAYPGAVSFEPESLALGGNLLDGSADQYGGQAFTELVFNQSRTAMGGVPNDGPQGRACRAPTSNNAPLGMDERIAFSGLARNDATRQTAGTMNRRCMMDPYLREEVAAREADEWWGRDEY